MRFSLRRLSLGAANDEFVEVGDDRMALGGNLFLAQEIAKKVRKPREFGAELPKVRRAAKKVSTTRCVMRRQSMGERFSKRKRNS
jgi:hypothetical protein